MHSIQIAPSILSADFAKLGEEVEKVTKAGADLIHIDVMDGHFVPNITIGPDVIKSLRKYSDKPFDVHLMIENVDFFIPKFIEAGADIVTIHEEASIHLDRSLSLIKSMNKLAGVSLVPSTSPEFLDYIIDKLDLILVMTVNPGFGGQQFLDSQLKKIEIISNKIKNSGKNIMLQVDGGINSQTAVKVVNAGADTLVAGNYIFSGDYKERIESLKSV